jgi:hypothetical protein
MARFARLGAQQAQELGQINTATCSTCHGNARARPSARPRARCTTTLQPCAHARARGYKANPDLNRTPRTLPTLPEHKFTGVCPVVVQSPATIDRPLQPSSTLSDPLASFPGAQWSSSSRRPSTTSPETPDWRRRTSTGRRRTRPSYMVSHSSIPHAYNILDLQWSSPSHLIELYCREQAGAHAADEPDRLRTRPAPFRPSPPASRPSTWSLGPPGPHPALHRTSPAADKPRHPFSSLRQRGSSG